MARHVGIQVPQHQLPGIKQFLDEPLQTLQTLVSCIVSSEPSTDIENLAEYCQSTSGVDSGIAEEVITLAINLNRIKRALNKTSDEVIKAIPISLHGHQFWNNELALKWVEREALLQQLLTPDGTIEVMAKIRELHQECQTILLEAKVMTDLRYVYNGDASKIVGGLVLNTLGIDVMEGHNQVQQMHVLLSDNEIEELIDHLQRAQKKSLLAKEMLVRMSISDLTPNRESD